jgi:hypothetical protein
MRLVPTAPVAAGSFVLGYAVVAATGSRTLGGLVLLLGGLWCARTWLRRHGPRTAGILLGVAAAAFVASHLLGLVVGPWPAVLVTAVAVGAAAWVRADARAVGAVG